MKTKFVGSVLILAGLALVAMPLQTEAEHCSNGKAALVNGELQRTAVIPGVYDTNVNHGRDIFQRR